MCLSGQVMKGLSDGVGLGGAGGGCMSLPEASSQLEVLGSQFGCFSFLMMEGRLS